MVLHATFNGESYSPKKNQNQLTHIEIKMLIYIYIYITLHMCRYLDSTHVEPKWGYGHLQPWSTLHEPPCISTDCNTYKVRLALLQCSFGQQHPTLPLSTTPTKIGCKPWVWGLSHVLLVRPKGHFTPVIGEDFGHTRLRS